MTGFTVPFAVRTWVAPRGASGPPAQAKIETDARRSSAASPKRVLRLERRNSVVFISVATRANLLYADFSCLNSLKIGCLFLPMLELPHPTGDIPYGRLDATPRHARHAARRYGALSHY